MIGLETLVSFALVGAVPQRRIEDDIIQFDSTATGQVMLFADQQIEPEVLIADTLENVIAKDIGAIPQVAHVLTEDVPEALLVWIVLEGNPDRHVRRRVYEKELGLISEFPDNDFDFNVIPAMGRHVAEIITGAKLVFSRQN